MDKNGHVSIQGELGNLLNSYMDDVNGKDFRIGSIVNRVTFDD